MSLAQDDTRTSRKLTAPAHCPSSLPLIDAADRCPGSTGTLGIMEHHLSLGAHMLLWGFPVALAMLVAVAAIHDARHEGAGS